MFRIWVPTTGKVISTRDVIFNENEIYTGKPPQEMPAEAEVVTDQEIAKETGLFGSEEISRRNALKIQDLLNENEEEDEESHYTEVQKSCDNYDQSPGQDLTEERESHRDTNLSNDTQVADADKDGGLLGRRVLPV